MDLSRYNKLIAGILGNVLPVVLVWLATKTPMAQCDAQQVCTLLGFSAAQLTVGFMLVFNAIFIGAAPKNSMTAAEAVKEVAVQKLDGEEIKIQLPNTVEGRKLELETPANVTVAKAA